VIALLVAAMLAWQPTWHAVRPGELEAVAQAIGDGCAADPWPSEDRCPWLLAALAFRESSWRANAIGRRGELGLMQLHGLAHVGVSREEALVPARNVALALKWLRHGQDVCASAGWASRPDFVARVLGAYGGRGCRAGRGDLLALRWERELREAH
jgi:hypothetical protein